MQGDPRFTHTYFNMSNGEDARGPWNKGQGPWEKGEEWEYVADPISQVEETHGQAEKEIAGHSRDQKATRKMEKELASQRSTEIKKAATKGEQSWSDYASTDG
jgi:Mn-containing catalase